MFVVSYENNLYHGCDTRLLAERKPEQSYNIGSMDDKFIWMISGMRKRM